jgi:anaerobic nitric oxide reductase flavorubredoxin
MVTEIAEEVYWVGVVDWALRHFHGYELSTPRGSTYNSYLIKDEKTVLVDTAWRPFADDFVAHVSEVTDPAAIDIVVANHAEPDHSGGLPAIMRHCPDATVVVSKRGAESVPGYYHQDWNFKAVGTGDRIKIGKRELLFVEAPMLHWPDSMFTYLTGANVLMPNDAFGQHYATDRRFNDEVDQHVLYEQALRYYANILTPFSDLVIKKIDEILALKLPVDVIAPSHGVIWRDEPLQIVEKYKEWAAQKGEERAVVLYDTMWPRATWPRRWAQACSRGASRIKYSTRRSRTATRCSRRYSRPRPS